MRGQNSYEELSLGRLRHDSRRAVRFRDADGGETSLRIVADRMYSIGDLGLRTSRIHTLDSGRCYATTKDIEKTS